MACLSLFVSMGTVLRSGADELYLSQKQQAIFEDAQHFATSIQTKTNPLSTCTATQNSPLHEPRVLVFVSFSMGEAALQQYAAEAKKAGAALVFRGLIGDSMKATVLRLQSLVQKTKASFLIDPPAFRRFGIDKIPAVVVAKDERSWDVVYGLTTLDYALEKISKDGETAASAALALQKLRGKTG